ncbi:uncharacterized protein PAN0_007c3264 [Moesziomyces antarcticus]|uniref:Uncharacterized protein n=1 Tax=Pseudozyma antarctica TaxID=84753 RepID=A0A081CEF1_PSEA2|nr:uncharacterized protein PAN0_007c3264 [Moesziomyces antarcticus]GAK65047.1 hypothetical protein PAN0_007c3264 [Moesziomyces antarcticus]
MARDARLGPFVAPALAPLQRITSRDDARDTGQIRGPSSTPTSAASEEEASSKRQLAKYRSRLRLHLFVSAPQIVGRRLASLASAHASLEKALRLAGQTSVFSASAPNSPVVSHVADVWSLAELRS